MDYFARRQAQRMAHKSLPSGFKKSRSAEEETPIGIDFATHEYAVERKVLEAPGLELTYYVDVVGDVPINVSPSRSTGGMYDIGNGDTDPEWGFDLVIFGGFVRYGPWTDRQRCSFYVISVMLLTRVILESSCNMPSFLPPSTIMRSHTI